jgi:competence protein ComEC
MSTHFKTIIFVAGIALGIVVGFSSPVATELAVGALVITVVQLVVYSIGRKRGAVGASLSLCTSLCMCGVFVGVVRVQMLPEKVPFTCESSCTFDAHIVASPQKKDAYQTVVVRPLDAKENTLDIQMRVPLYPDMKIGETIRVSGKVTLPHVIYPHGDATSFDYVSYLHTHDIGSEMIFPRVEVLDHEAHTVRDILGRAKEHMVGTMNRIIASPASSLASGMLFGEEASSKELKDTFRVAGLSHIVVLSGFNIAIVISFVLFVLRFLPLLVRIGLASLSVIIFVCMVGAEASVMRATIMSFIGLLAVVVGRQYVAQQALIISFLCIILYEPYALTHDVSLHLSFLATVGIVYGTTIVDSLIPLRVTSRSLRELTSTTCAAYMATVPYLMYTFGSVSLYALFANMLALPLVSIGMFVSFLTLIVSYCVPSLALPIGFVTSTLLDVIIMIARVTAELPFASFGVSLSFTSMVVCYVVLIAGSVIYTHKKKNETWQTTEAGNLTGVISY